MMYSMYSMYSTGTVQPIPEQLGWSKSSDSSQRPSCDQLRPSPTSPRCPVRAALLFAMPTKQLQAGEIWRRFFQIFQTFTQFQNIPNISKPFHA